MWIANAFPFSVVLVVAVPLDDRLNSGVKDLIEIGVEQDGSLSENRATADIWQSANECSTLDERRESSIASNRFLNPRTRDSTARTLCGSELEIDDTLASLFGSYLLKHDRELLHHKTASKDEKHHA